MKLPLQITYRNLARSGAIDADIREKAEKLNQYFNGIMSCRVIVEAMHKHHHKGNVYAIHIDITVPGKEIAVSREPSLDHAHEDIYVAIRDAFDAAKRRLQDHSAKVQKQVKAHETPLHGTVLLINSSQDFGMIKTSDEREVYFHRNSLLNAKLEELEIGTKVRFHEEAGEKGAQASSILVEGKHHVVG